MKILIISTKCDHVNISGLKTDIIPWNSNKLGGINLRDYDGIIFDMSDYYLSPYVDNSTRGIFEKYSISPDIIYDVLKKPETFIIIVGNPNTKVKDENLLKLIGFSVSSENRSGDTIVREKTTDKTFAKYLDNVKSYEFFLHDNIHLSEDVQTEWRSGISGYKMIGRLTPLLKNRADKILAAKLEPFSRIPSPYVKKNNQTELVFGDIFLLPSIDDMSKNDMISGILKLYLGEEKPEPEWAKSIKNREQNKIEKELKKAEDTIAKLIKKKKTLIDELDTIRQPIEILWKIDKPLEKSIEKVLKSMGAIINTDENTESENAADCSFAYKTMNFAVEIKSTTKQVVDKKGLRQVRDWVEDLSDAEKDYKGLFIVSNEVNKEPSKRSSSFLPDNLIEYAKKQEIAVISVKTLFNIYNATKDDASLTDKFFKGLYSQNGVYETKTDNDNPPKTPQS